jgi:pyridoxamine 5'-phosphate oxidase family protein
MPRRRHIRRTGGTAAGGGVLSPPASPLPPPATAALSAVSTGASNRRKAVAASTNSVGAVRAVEDAVRTSGAHLIARTAVSQQYAVMAVSFSAAERAYLDSQRLGRLATVASDGQPQNNPVGFFVDDELGVVDIGGRAMGKTKKFRNVRANSRVSFVVDDLASVQPWHVRGVEIRGRAEAITDWQPPYPGYSHEAIRIHPERIISWGLEGTQA